MSFIKCVNKNYIKIIAAILIASLMTVSYALPGFAVTHGAVSDLKDYNIIDDVPLEDMRLDETITRAEFSKLIIHLMNLQSVSNGEETRFSDVPKEHWASGYIEFCAALGIFQGVGNGCFAPENPVVLQDVLKTIVAVLGYDISAERNGGYPQGYINEALRLKLLNDVEGNYAEVATRADVFQVIANSLDVDMVDVVSYSNEYVIEKGKTLRNSLTEYHDLFAGVGIVTATHNAYLIGENTEIEEDEVEIDGRLFKIGNSNAESFFGAKVTYTATEDETTGDIMLVSVHLHKSVEYLQITDDEFENYDNSVINYRSSDNDRWKKAKIHSTPIIVYNNRPISKKDFKFQNGNIRMFDNDRDGLFDIVHIEDYISVVAEDVSSGSKLIRFAGPYAYTDPLTNQTASMISFDDRDERCQIDIRSSDGSKIEFEEIKEGMLVSLFISLDGHFRKVVVNDRIIEGTLEEIGETEWKIDTVTYELENKDISYFSKDEIKPGLFVSAYINLDGKIGYVNVSPDENEKYGYITGQDKEGLSTSRVQIVFAGTMEVIEEDKDNDPETTGDITKYLVARNDSIQIKKLSKNLRLDGRKIEGDEALPQMVPLKFKINSEDEITRISTLTDEIMMENKVYSASERVFGKTMGKPFGFNDNTKVLCIPNNEVSDENDYLAEVRMENGQGYKITGYEYDEDNNCDVKLFSVVENMVYDDEPTVGYMTKIAVVANTKWVKNENDEYVLEITLLTDGVRKTIIAAEYSAADIDSLKIGDVIYYSKNARGELVNYTMLAELSLAVGSYLRGANTEDERAFGPLSAIEYDKIDALRNWRVHKLTLLIDNPVNYILRINNTPPVFIYDKRNKTVSFGSIDDLCVGSDWVFVQSKTNVPQGFVVVRN